MRGHRKTNKAGKAKGEAKAEEDTAKEEEHGKAEAEAEGGKDEAEDMEAAEKGADKSAEETETEDAKAAAGADEGKEDTKTKDASRLLKVGDKVQTHASKNKAKYDARGAEVVGLLSRQVKVILLDGPAKGEKRKFPYDAVTAVSADSVDKKLANYPTKSDPSAAPAVQASTEASAAPAAQATTGAAASSNAAAETKEPDAIVKALFGNLSGFD